MLVIDENSVYEIDEECLAKRGAPKDCGTAQKVEENRKRMWNKKKTETDVEYSNREEKG